MRRVVAERANERTRGDREPRDVDRHLRDGERVIELTEAAFRGWPVPPTLPTWIRNPWLVALLMGRLSMGVGGGGQRRTLSTSSMCRLLARPEKLTQFLEELVSGVDGEATRQLKAAIEKIRRASAQRSADQKRKKSRA